MGGESIIGKEINRFPVILVSINLKTVFTNQKVGY